MSIAWLVPAAFAGLILIALPIAVHLLVRQHARTVAYPSLRFLRETQLAAFRRRSIEDALLLLCRVAIIVLAALALAGPVFQTAARTASDARRLSRAIVPLGDVDASAIRAAGDGAFVADTFVRARVVGALADASRWLDRQPRASREIVLIGMPRAGVISDSDLTVVPPDIGIRFTVTSNTSSATSAQAVLMRRDGTLSKVERPLQLDAATTRVTDGAAEPVAADLVTIVASRADSPLADAALRAALDAGVPWADFTRKVTLVWGSADVAPAAGTHVVRMPVPSPAATAADAVRVALATASTPVLLDPVLITPDQLVAWTRAPGPPSPDAPIADEGDRRWLWAAALALLVVEWWMRRSTEQSKIDANDAEARVA